MNTLRKKFIPKLLLLLFALQVPTAFATHNVSRYFPFIERTEEYIIKKRSHLTPSFFYVNASSAHRRGGSTGGIPELWGMYDLKDVIASLQAVNPLADPIMAVTGNNALANRSIQFRPREKVGVVGLQLNYEQDLHFAGFQVGASLAVMNLNATMGYNFDREHSDPIFNSIFLTERQKTEQDLLVDKIRRVTHDTIGFTSNIWNEAGFGDLDVHLRWNHIFDHVLLMRSIDINAQLGAIVPTGFTSEINMPGSLSIGSNGHWGLYVDLITALELKPDWTLGFIFGWAHLFPHTRTLQIPFNNEPAIFSSIVGRVRMKPGETFKISPFFTLGNLTDGLDFQVRYTYLRHSDDVWTDMRSDKTIQSYLQRGGDLIAQKENLSRWRAQYVTLQLTYDTKIAMKNYTCAPVLFAGYDIPIGGNGIAKAHQFTVGVELHF